MDRLLDDSPLISVIVPIWNTEQYLDTCVKSISGQSYKNLEILLVDDGSKDKSPEICDQWAEKDDRIRVFHRDNKGVSRARNIGLDHATGEYISFVDSDDYLDPDYYETMYTLLRDNQADMSMCKWRVLDDTENWVPQYMITHTILAGVYTAERFLSQIRPPYIWNYLIKADLCKKLRFNENLVISEDYYYATCVALKCNTIVVTNRRLYNYVLHEGSTSQEMICLLNKKKLRDMIEVSLDHYHLFMDHHMPELARESLIGAYSALLIPIRAKLFFHGDNAKILARETWSLIVRTIRLEKLHSISFFPFLLGRYLKTEFIMGKRRVRLSFFRLQWCVIKHFRK